MSFPSFFSHWQWWFYQPRRHFVLRILSSRGSYGRREEIRLSRWRCRRGRQDYLACVHVRRYKENGKREHIRLCKWPYPDLFKYNKVGKISWWMGDSLHLWEKERWCFYVFGRFRSSSVCQSSTRHRPNKTVFYEIFNRLILIIHFKPTKGRLLHRFRSDINGWSYFAHP